MRLGTSPVITMRTINIYCTVVRMRPDRVFDVTGTDKKKARRLNTSCSLYLAGLYRQTIIMTHTARNTVDKKKVFKAALIVVIGKGKRIVTTETQQSIFTCLS